MMLTVAFKEWAVICRALAEGRQSLILRKGGIAEEGGQFRPEHPRFLLYPSFFHEQHCRGIRTELRPLLEAAEKDKPEPGAIRFSHFAHVEEVWLIQDLDRLLALEGLHGWTAEEVTRRFRYREPGLYVLAVRVHALALPVEAVERPEYAGCKTWVHLDVPLDPDGSTPVLTDDAFAETVARIKARLG